MKQAFAGTLIAIVFAATLMAIPVHVSAGALCDGLPKTTAAEQQIYQDCLVSEAGADTGAYDSASIQSSNDAAMQSALAADKAAAQNTANDLKPGEGEGFGKVMTWIASLFAWLVGVAALTLDFSVYFTVIKMGDYVHNLAAVGITWRILRDIGNIFLIFGFLAIGISIILNTERLGYGKKMLPMLLFAAVFINFSLFFTEAVIDVGNLFATQFFTQINGGVQPTADYLIKTTTGSEGISNKIMAQVGLQTIYTEGSVKKDVFKAGNTWVIGFMAILLFITTAFVMFSLAFVLISRFVILLFLIILAPIGFAGFAVPQLASMATKWKDSLFQQTITAPVLFLLLYIALAVITDASFLTGLGAASPNATSQTTWVGFIDGRLTGFGSLLLTFLIAMGLLLFVTIASKSLSAVGAAGATKLAGKLSFGAAAWGTRFGIGTVLGRGLLGNRVIKKGAVSNNKLVRYGSRAASFTGKLMQNRTYDVRNIPGVGALHLDAGTASKMTAKQAQEKQYGVKPAMEWFRNASKEYEKEAADLDKKKAISDPTHADFEKTLKKLSADELTELRGIRKGLAPYVKTLSPAKYSELQKSDKLLQIEKDNLKTAWNAQFSPATAAATISRFSTEEIATLDADTLKKPDVVAALGPTEFDAVRRKGNLTKDNRRDMHAQMVAAAAANPAFMAQYTDYFSPANDPGGARDKYWRV